MMQNIRNGEPVVFNHNCPVGRKGVTMNQDEYGSFLEEMVFQCFAFANIELTRLPKANASKRITFILYQQKVINFLASLTRSINLARLAARSSLLIYSTRSALSTKRSASSPVRMGVSFIILAIAVTYNLGRVSGGTFTLPSHGTVLDSLPSHGSSYLTLLLIVTIMFV